MAIGFENSGNGAGTTSASCSVACTGSNTILFAAVTVDNGAASISAITVDGNAMTLVDTQTNTGNSTFLYYYLAPASGSVTVSVSISGGTNVHLVAACYSGAAQQAPEANAKGSTLGSSLATNVTTSTDNDWTVMAAGTNQTDSVASGARDQNHNGTFAASGALYDSNGGISPAGSTSLTASWDASGRLANVIAALAPAATVANGSLLLTGVGS